MEEATNIVEVRGVSKRFAGIQALDQVDLTLKRGTITALIGENGAGKSTLVKILAGYHRRDGGEIRLDGQEVEIENVLHAQALGISVIHQVPSFAPDLSVADNIFLGRELHREGRFGPLSRYDSAQETERILPLIEQYGGSFSPRDRLRRLKAYQQRLVGIIKALIFKARILIMDEPTAALPMEERELLISRILQLKEEGYSILYVSHHLDEIEKVADEIVALRDGKLSGYKTVVPTQAEMIEMMTGDRLSRIAEVHDREVRHQSGEAVAPKPAIKHSFAIEPAAGNQPGSVVLEPLSLSFNPGEIVVFTGLVGSGTKEIAEAMFGMRSGWKVYYGNNGAGREIRNPGRAIDAGIGYLSDDRIGEAMIPDFSVHQNLTIPMLTKVSRLWGHIQDRRERSVVESLCGKLKVRMSSMDQSITSLSGGNQQKVMLARWLFTEVKFLILNEPTQGIDVMAKQDVIKLLLELAGMGGTCVIATNDPEEFLHTADRVIVMQRGSIVAEYVGREIQPEAVLKSMLIHQ